jgi:hypothetical protein
VSTSSIRTAIAATHANHRPNPSYKAKQLPATAEAVLLKAKK